jgi:hypothetical protein
MELSATGERNLEALAAELQTLETSLRLATDAFCASTGSERRCAVRAALNVLSNFVGNVFSLDQDLRLPLNQLLYELHDLDHGQVGPLLKRSEVSHRAKKPLASGFLRASAAALMDLYQQDNVPRDQAARRAAIKLNERGYRDDKGRRITAKEVERWRDELKSPRDKGDAAVVRYNCVLEWLKSSHPGKPDAAAEFLLDALPDGIAPSIPKIPAS